MNKKWNAFLSLVALCLSACSIGKPTKKYENRIFDYNPKYFDTVYSFSDSGRLNFASLYKFSFKNIDENVYEYTPDSIEINNSFDYVTDTEFGLVGYIDKFIGCESENEMVVSSRKDIGDSVEINDGEGGQKQYNLKNLKTFFMLDDCFYGEKNKLHKYYIDAKSIDLFISAYDYFYVNLSSVCLLYQYATFHRDTLYKGEKIDISEGVILNLKGFRCLPIKDGKVKLDDLQDFNKRVFAFGYEYNSIKEYGTDKSFTDYIWNDMTEEELINSFENLFENPPNKSPYYG